MAQMPVTGAGQGLDIRMFDPRDLPRVMEIEVACFGHDAYDGETFLHWLRLCPQLCRVLEIGGVVAGYILGMSRGLEGSIVSIGVDPAWRRQGVGRALVEDVLQRLHASGVRRVHLEARFDDLQAIGFWRDRGFSADGVVPAYYADGMTALTMRRSLEEE